MYREIISSFTFLLYKPFFLAECKIAFHIFLKIYNPQFFLILQQNICVINDI